MSWEDREWARWTPSERERFFGRVVGPRSSTDASRVVVAMLVAAAITIAAWVLGLGRPIPFVGRSTPTQPVQPASTAGERLVCTKQALDPRTGQLICVEARYVKIAGAAVPN
jgi:hypothetical protein